MVIDYQGPNCPPNFHKPTHVQLGDGSGGVLTSKLIDNMFLPHLANEYLAQGNDGAIIEINSNNRLVVSTDGHVVSPIVFPGGDIGKLAVCGTVNDVTMMGAEPHYLTASFILEEGLELSLLEQIVKSMKVAADEAGVVIIAGDTKVVEKGKVDSIYITTSGIGSLSYPSPISASNAQIGDSIILSGTIGDHAIAILNARNELGIDSPISSDVAPLNHLVKRVLETSDGVHVMRDPTRGGIAMSLNDIAESSSVGINLHESKIPIKPEVEDVCELLGFDPYYLANEGKFLLFVASKYLDEILKEMHKHKYGQDATVIGKVVESHPGTVVSFNDFGGTRIIDSPSGLMLPRIC